jgi:hypothetical protein
MIAKLCSSYVLVKIGLKSLFNVSYSIALVGTIFMVIFANSAAFMPYFLLLSRFGTSIAIVGAYQGVTLLMPT